MCNFLLQIHIYPTIFFSISIKDDIITCCYKTQYRTCFLIITNKLHHYNFTSPGETQNPTRIINLYMFNRLMSKHKKLNESCESLLKLTKI